jgi:hypothetical protein
MRIRIQLIPSTGSGSYLLFNAGSCGSGSTTLVVASVADPDPGAGAFLTPGPGSGIRNKFIPDPGSRMPDSGSQTHILIL